MKFLIFFQFLTMICARDQLAPGPDPLEMTPQNEEQPKDVSKRSLAIPWFIPAVYSVPQVIEVHHVVYLQQPDVRCYPPPPFPRPTPGPDNNTTGGTSPGLEMRLGETNTTTTPEPSRCVWAIVACCAPGSRNIRYTCFELLGCQGAFWDVNPCETSVVMAAANTALNFYMTKGPPNPNNNDGSSDSIQ